jgi:hypothetical protein
MLVHARDDGASDFVRAAWVHSIADGPVAPHEPDLGPPPTIGEHVAGLVFLIVTLAIWIGAIDASREIIREGTVIEREAAVGVGRRAYLLSKLVVLGVLAAAQSVLLLLVIAPVRPGAPNAGELLALVLATTLTAVSMGLLISASVVTENQAVSLIPLALIPQLLFAGQIVPYAPMASVLKAISTTIFARWAFARLGSHCRNTCTANPSKLGDIVRKHFLLASVRSYDNDPGRILRCFPGSHTAATPKSGDWSASPSA